MDDYHFVRIRLEMTRELDWQLNGPSQIFSGVVTVFWRTLLNDDTFSVVSNPWNTSIYRGKDRGGALLILKRKARCTQMIQCTFLKEAFTQNVRCFIDQSSLATEWGHNKPAILIWRALYKRNVPTLRALHPVCHVAINKLIATALIMFAVTQVKFANSTLAIIKWGVCIVLEQYMLERCWLPTKQILDSPLGSRSKLCMSFPWLDLHPGLRVS